MGYKIDDSKLMALCLTGRTQTQIAEELGMTKAQICRRINKPSFQEMLSAYRKQVLDAVLTELTAYSQRSVETLVSLLDDESSFIKLQAACKILALAQDYGVQRDILRDVEEWRQSQYEL